LPGVRNVVALEPSPWTGKTGAWAAGCAAGVAVVADTYWHAVQGRRALQIEWDEGAAATLDSDGIRAQFTRLAEQPGVEARKTGDPGAAPNAGAKAVGAPVKVIWSREDDVQHGFYRPATYNKFAAGLDASGTPLAWTHRIVAPPILLKFGPLDKGIDRTLIDGAANLPYAIPNLLVDQVAADLLPVPLGFWRSVGISQNAFVTECFFDEVATAAGKDPFELRRQLLHDKPRHLRTLEL